MSFYLRFLALDSAYISMGCSVSTPLIHIAFWVYLIQPK